MTLASAKKTPYYFLKCIKFDLNLFILKYDLFL